MPPTTQNGHTTPSAGMGPTRNSPMQHIFHHGGKSFIHSFDTARPFALVGAVPRPLPPKKSLTMTPEAKKEWAAAYTDYNRRVLEGDYSPKALAYYPTREAAEAGKLDFQGLVGLQIKEVTVCA